MGAENEETKDPPKTEDKPAPKEDDAAKVKDAEKAGKAAGLAALAQKFEFSTVADLEKYIADQKQAEKERLSEVERKQQEAEAKEKQAHMATAEATKKAEDADIYVALVEAGAAKDSAKKLIGNVRGEVPEGTELNDETIKKAVKELGKAFPALFGTEKPPPPGGSNPGPQPPGAKGDGSQNKSRGLELVHERHANIIKKKT